jgi:hypothetical protein
VDGRDIGERKRRRPSDGYAGHDDGTETFFIIFVDAIFTTLFERPFTNVFDVMAQTPASACVYPARTTG